jgi:lysozyme
MKTGKAGRELIKSFEGIRDGDPTTVNLDPYLCPADVVTIGWGHVVIHEGRVLRGREGLSIAHQLYPNGITMEEAEELLVKDIEEKEREVNKLLKIAVTQNQFDALMSFAFNVGTDIDEDDIPEGLGDSTLLKYTNQGLFQAAAREFSKWNKAGGKIRGGLIRRRAAEKELFLSNKRNDA